MIDPVIISFKLFNWEIVLRWYGVLVIFLRVLVRSWEFAQGSRYVIRASEIVHAVCSLVNYQHAGEVALL